MLIAVEVLSVQRALSAAVVACVALVAGAASAASPTAHVAAHRVTLDLQGGYANNERTACGIRHHYTYYHPRRSVPFNGQVAPAPRKPWRVKTKVKKCVRGRFVTVSQVHVAGDSAGRFRGRLRPLRRGFYFARAYYYGDLPASRSDKQYFRVR